MATNVEPIMQFGVTGPVVMELQADLRKAGFAPGENVGIYDRDTLAAVRSFQTAHGLPPTGNADAKTIRALKLQVGSPVENAPQPPTGLEGTDDEKPKANVVQLHPDLLNSVKKFAAQPSQALAPVHVVGAVDDPDVTPFYKKPAFVLTAVLAVAGLGLYAISQANQDEAFDTFEDADSLEEISDVLPAPVLGSLSKRRRKSRAKSKKPAAKSAGKKSAAKPKSKRKKEAA